MNKQVFLYIFAFVISISMHLSLLSGTTFFLSSPAPLITPIPEHRSIKMRFVDSVKTNRSQPQSPTDLISDNSNTASCPKNRSTDKFKQIKTTTPKKPPGQNIPSYRPQKQTPPASSADSTKIPKNKKRQKNKNLKTVLEKKQVIIQKKFEDPAKQTAKTKEKTDSPKTDHPKPVKQTASKPDSFLQGQQSSKRQPPQTGKIDDLVHKAQTDENLSKELLDLLAFNVKKNRLGEYWARVKRKISRNWQTRMLPYSAELFESKATIVFKISSDGSIAYIKSIGSYGNSFFIKDCESAIRESANFEPLPKEYIHRSGKKYLWVYMTFWYNFGS